MDTLEFGDLDQFLLAQSGRIIHQVWFTNITNKRTAKKLYKRFKKCRDSWKIKNPTWYHIEWDQYMADKLAKTFYPEHYDMYKSYEYSIQRCDTIRYMFLHRYGGIYADMDYYCNKPFDDVFSKFKGNFYLVSSPNNGGKYVSNSLMFSIKGHSFWKRLLIRMEIDKFCPVYYSRHMVIMYTTGPSILTRVYNNNKHRLGLRSWPAKLFHPHGIGENIMSLKDNKVYAMHLGSATWEKKDSKILIYFYLEWKIILFIVIIMLTSIVYSIVN